MSREIQELDIQGHLAGIPELTNGHGEFVVYEGVFDTVCDAIMADLDAEAQAHDAQREAALGQIAACAAALHTLSVGVDEVIDEVEGAVRNVFAVDAVRILERLRKARADALVHTEGGGE